MKTSDFDFHLPEDRIALRPVSPRHSARLLVVDERWRDLTVLDLPDLLAPDDVLVFNDTRVVAARLFGARARDASSVRVEATLHRRLAPDRWSAFMRPGRRLRVGDVVRFDPPASPEQPLRTDLTARVEAKGEAGHVTLAFDVAGPALDQALAQTGVMPLPPYIASRRAEDEQDRRDYQTIYARQDGSVAAPTAGLHFTPELLEALAARGVAWRFVTLHVGAGTFLPVKTDALEDHRMHAEWGEVSAQTASALNAARARGGRIVCVGTTSLRLLESATDRHGLIQGFCGETDIFIRPGYEFRAADVLMTNFHLPKSTLLMLVSAFCGVDRVRAAYAHAVETGYRFYSYGDAGLWFSEDSAR